MPFKIFIESPYKRLLHSDSFTYVITWYWFLKFMNTENMSFGKQSERGFSICSVI